MTSLPGDGPSTATSPPTESVDWRLVSAFGLPPGSIRAALALLVFGTVWTWMVMVPEQNVPQALRDVLFIILGHYFAVRRPIGNQPESGPPPLYLPRGSVRLLLILGFVVVGVLLYRAGRLDPDQPARFPAGVTLLLVAGFLLGVVLNRLRLWWLERRKLRPRRLFENIKAVIGLVAGLVLVLSLVNQLSPFIVLEPGGKWMGVPVRFGEFGIEQAAAAVVGFYFGSRS